MDFKFSGFPALSQASIEDLQHGLQEQLFTSAVLVKKCLSRINQANPILNAVIQINPDAGEIAKKLDDERAEGKFRGPLHGIPVLLKDTFCTLDSMSTSAGTYALVNTRPSTESTTVQLLRSAGVIILGKTNLKGHAYFTYLQTSGSIVEPAGKCSIVGLKPTVGLTSRAGIIPGIEFQDTVGPMTRSVKDSAYVLNAIAGKDPLDVYTMDIPFEAIPDYTSFCKEDGLKGIRIGIPREIIIQSVEDVQILRDFDSALHLMKSQGAIVVEDANFPSFKCGWTQENSLCSQVSFEEMMAEYLDSFAVNPDNLHSVDDIITFIKTHGKEEHYPEYGITVFEAISALTENNDSEEFRDALKLRTFIGSTGGVLGALEKYDCDVLVFPTEPDNPTDIAGYPTINVPMGFCDINTPTVYSSPNLVDKAPNVPHGLLFTTRKWREDVLIQCAYAYECASHVQNQVKLMVEPTIKIWDTKRHL